MQKHIKKQNKNGLLKKCEKMAGDGIGHLNQFHHRPFFHIFSGDHVYSSVFGLLLHVRFKLLYSFVCFFALFPDLVDEKLITR